MPVILRILSNIYSQFNAEIKWNSEYTSTYDKWSEARWSFEPQFVFILMVIEMSLLYLLTTTI